MVTNTHTLARAGPGGDKGAGTGGEAYKTKHLHDGISRRGDGT